MLTTRDDLDKQLTAIEAEFQGTDSIAPIVARAMHKVLRESYLGGGEFFIAEPLDAESFGDRSYYQEAVYAVVNALNATLRLLPSYITP